jgi:hypothetical protein
LRVGGRPKAPTAFAPLAEIKLPVEVFADDAAGEAVAGDVIDGVVGATVTG